MEKKDKTIVCKDCGAEFVFTVNEQAFYEEKGFTNEPARCKECRDKKKAERNNNRNFSNKNRY
ncbi:MAG: zinc-ribbon domain-containing protein [Bacilli bacterium]|nr:zinc-ribbon domain-containing protein [Bacilli bacterium]MDD4547325.1 zinc-ribbon domain-containing protein [Bacilli bacterium]